MIDYTLSQSVPDMEVVWGGGKRRWLRQEGGRGLTKISLDKTAFSFLPSAGKKTSVYSLVPQQLQEETENLQTPDVLQKNIDWHDGKKGEGVEGDVAEESMNLAENMLDLEEQIEVRRC